MRYGKGMISMWAVHYIRLYNLKVGFNNEMRAIEEEKKEMSMEDLLLTAITLRNLKTVYDEPETCPDCGGRKTVLGHTKDDMWRYSQCDDCGLIYETPIENGVVMTSKEEVIDNA